ncbi:ParB N-terminal domain-containing protein [Mycobacterium haemophilum]|uniref:ParB N-terminal domain-containing protein n=1 Tax=Mycobacterium haemophilum TaxID=29311 RepID=UPI0034DCD04C
MHRSTMQIVDGFHRVAAAERRGVAEIEARFLDGPMDTAFLAPDLPPLVTCTLVSCIAPRASAEVTISPPGPNPRHLFQYMLYRL